MGKAAAGRLARRSSDAGFLPLAGAERAELGKLGKDFGPRVSEMFDVYAALCEAEPTGAMSQLSRLLDVPEELVLLCLAAGPSLERGLAQSHRALDPDCDQLTAGLLLDLASTLDTHRLMLSRALHPDAALRRSGLLVTASREGIDVRTRIRVAPAALSAFRGEPIPVPSGVDVIADQGRSSVAGAILDAFGLPPSMPGQLTLLTGASPNHLLATARLMAMAAHASVSLVSDPALIARCDDAQWIGWLRDAALARALLVCDLGESLSDGVLRSVGRAVQHSGLSAVAMAARAEVPGALADRITVVDCAGLNDAAKREAAGRAVGSEPVLGAGLLRCIEDLALHAPG